MAIVQISRIQIRRGQKLTGSGVPQLAGGELGWAVDTRELYIGNGSVSEGSPAVGNSKVLTENIPLINNDNAQKEYYLPDIFNFIHTKDTYIHKIDDFTEISGVNTIEQLKNIENNYLK